MGEETLSLQSYIYLYIKIDKAFFKKKISAV